MCAHTHLRIHLNPLPLHILSSLPSSLPMPNPEAKSNPSKRLPSASLATLCIHQGGCLLGLIPVSIHTQFRSSFFLTMVTIRHLSTLSLQTPPSTKMPLLLWLCIAQTPMPMPAPRQQRALRGSLQINTFHPLPPQRLQFLSTARLRSLGFHIPRPAILLQARRTS